MIYKMDVRTLVVISVILHSAFGQEGKLNISVSTDNSFNITVSGQQWFRSGPIKVRNKGAWLSSTDGSLTLNGTYATSGEDVIGAYQFMFFQYCDKSGEFRFETFIKTYDKIGAITLGHKFNSGAEKTATDSADDVISSFPSFLVEDTSLELGYVTFEGNMMKNVHVGQWDSKSDITTGMSGGLPLTVFDKAMENTIVISPFTEFMATSSHLDTSSDPHVLQLGVFGKANEVPVNYSVEFIMVAGDTVTGTLQQWGQMLRTYYGKDDHYRKSDFSINYLGYWSDNGACYYYTTDKFSNYEEALVAVKSQADKEGIPYRYLQIDSWWYYKGKLSNGVKNWTAMPDVFPDGIASLSQKTGWALVAHNRYWASDTDYAKQNGGDFDFIIDPLGVSLPNDPQFWDYLFSVSVEQSWNLIVYEQDWLHTSVDRLPALQENVTLGRSWLMEMGAAAQKHDLTIQYCMPYTRHVMQSVEIPVVTQTRVSDDYSPSNSQWIIGDTTIVAHAVGLASFKDNFHTIVTEEGCHNKNDESYPELEVTVAALSGGPVGPSDRYDLFNKTLIMATCMENGLLLKPTRPAMSLDSTFVQRAFGEGGPDGQLWAGYTAYDENSPIWYFIFAAEIMTQYTLTSKELLLFDEKVSNGIIYQSIIGSGTVTYIGVFNATNPLKVPVCDKKDFQTWTIAPTEYDSSWVLLGETSKIIKMSEQRISKHMVTSGYLIVQLHGSPQEVITMAAINTNNDITVENVRYFHCTIPDDGEVILHIPDGWCQF